MSREYFCGFTAILNKPKYRRLSPAGRGALLHLWALAGAQDPEATWNSRDDLLDAFELEGFEAGSVDELIALRWIDIEPDGTLAVHDWDDWQLAASLAIQRSWEASRKRKWRRRKSPPLPPAPLSPEKIRGEERRTVPDTSGHVPDTSRTSRDGDDVSYEAYAKGPVNCGRCGDVILGASLRTSAGPYHSGGCPVSSGSQATA
jgi:hypothetical protein